MRQEPPRSDRYDDVYFLPDGLAEKHTVFVEGTRIESRWSPYPVFVVGELGFGTGLSMLATWAAAQAHPGFVQFVSVEEQPLSAAQIRGALGGFDALGPLLNRFLEVYPEAPLGAGVHHFDLSERFVLTLWVGQAEERLAEIDGAVDAWYLDGFAPAKNPAMWSPAVLDRVAALSAPDATLSSYTAAGEVRRGLEARGFEVERVPGFGDKRHRIVARYRGPGRRRSFARKVAVVGGGIAGASVARSLTRRGVDVVVFDGDQGRGASRNPLAMLSPRINRLDDPASHVHVRSFEYASRLYRDREALEAVGVLRLAVDDELRDRLEKGMRVGPLKDGPSARVSAAEAAERSGVRVSHSGVWLPEGGLVHPDRALPVLLSGAELRNANVLAFDSDRGPGRSTVRVHAGAEDEDVDAVVVASGAWTKRLLPALPLRASRGQLTVCTGGEHASRLRCVLSAHGYVSPAIGGRHVLGASYERVEVLEDTASRRSDDLANIERVARWAPELAKDIAPADARAAFRSLVPDHMPLMGRAGEVLTLSALGSRGFTLAPLGAEVLASELAGTVPPMERAQRAVVSPERYLRP